MVQPSFGASVSHLLPAMLLHLLASSYKSLFRLFLATSPIDCESIPPSLHVMSCGSVTLTGPKVTSEVKLLWQELVCICLATS